MAIPTSIKTLLSGDVVEWARIEFKETWDAAAYLKSICAFANDLHNVNGGYFYTVKLFYMKVLSIYLLYFLVYSCKIDYNLV